MLQSKWLVWGLGLFAGLSSWHCETQLSNEALTVLGVMLSVFFGFYISQMTILVGSSASRYLYEMTYKDRPSVRYLDTFISDYRGCTHCCLLTVSLLFFYLVFKTQVLTSTELVLIVNAIIVGMTTVSLLKLKQMFDVMLRLMKDEAPYAYRSTFEDIDTIKKKRKAEKENS